MRIIDRPEYRLVPRLPAYQRLVARSLLLIESWLACCQQPTVSVSGGKDSSVMLDLVRRVSPEVVAIHHHDEWLLPETEVYLRTVPNLIQLAHTCRHTDYFTAWDYAEAPPHLPAGVVWCEGRATTWCLKHGYDAVAIGLRADENTYRRLHIKARGQLFWCQKNTQWYCYPMAWWKTRDIWAYIRERNLPYNAAYDRLLELGAPASYQRLGPMATARATGTLQWLRAGWPELFYRFRQCYPAAGIDV